MAILVVIIHIFVCLFLIAVILLQAGRGQGLSWGVFGGTPESILGTKTSSFLSRLTTVCAILFLFTCIALNIVETRKARSLLTAKRPPSQIDIAKVKQALEKAAEEQTKKQASEPSAPVNGANAVVAQATSTEASAVSTTAPAESKSNQEGSVPAKETSNTDTSATQ